MATITIAADGTGNFLAPDASAYAALSTGSTANTVNWKPGVYRPSAGKWWGFGSSRALDKRCAHQVSGAGTVVLDARVFASSDSGDWTAHSSGVWKTTLFSHAAAHDTTFDCWFGAATGSAWSDIVLGQSYRPASSVANVTADGLTQAGMLAGYGIWTLEISGNDRVLYVWTGSDTLRPPSVWGGIAVAIASNGSPSAGTPRYGALVVHRSSAASANDPSGTTVGPGFAVLAAGSVCIGSAYRNDADASLPVADVAYDSVLVYGYGRHAFYVGSDAAGSVYSNLSLSGSWVIDDKRDPATYPENGDVTNRSPVFLADRCADAVISGGTIAVGNVHCAIELSGAAADPSEARCNGTRITGVAAAFKGDTDYGRWLSVVDASNTTVARCTATGQRVRTQLGGLNTLLHGCTLSGMVTNSTVSLKSRSSTGIRVRSGGETTASQVSVKLYANVIDLRGSDFTYTWAAIDIDSGSAGEAIAAGALDSRDNVCLLESGQAPFRIEQSGGGSVNANQTWVGGFHNGAVQAYSSAAANVLGTATTIAGLLSAGTVVAPTADSVANILRRGDAPLQRLAQSAVGATAA